LSVQDITYDALNSRFIAVNASNSKFGLWSWDAVWHKQSASLNPPRPHVNVAWDGASGEVLVGSYYNYYETYSWNGQTLSNLQVSYPGWKSHLVFVDHLDAVLAVGSSGGSLSYSQWSGSSWSKSVSLDSGWDNNPKTVFYDPGQEQLALFVNDELWFWDLGDKLWSPDVDVDDAPAKALQSESIGFDRARGVIVLIGLRELPGNGSNLPEQWEFRDGQWIQMEYYGPTYLTAGKLVSAQDRGWLALGKGSLAVLAQSLARPFATARFDLSGPTQILPAASDPVKRQFLEMGMRVHAGGISHTFGTGDADGESRPGFKVYLHGGSTAGRIELLDSEQGTVDSPVKWAQTYSAHWADFQNSYPTFSLQDWIYPDGSLRLLITTREAQGASTDPAEFTVDYAELRIVYVRGPVCDPASLCCNENGHFADDSYCDDGDMETLYSLCRGGTCTGFVPEFWQ
jgi:hypothetical protein